MFFYIFFKKSTFFYILAHHLHIARGAAGCRARDVDPPTPSLDGGARRVECSSQNLSQNFPKPFPGRPPLPPTLPEITGRIAFGRPSVELFSFLVDFCTPQKSLKRRIPQNTAKNLKSRTPDHPNIDLGMTFGVHLGIDFHEFLDLVIICVSHQNAFIQSISVGSAHPKSHISS